MMDASYIGSGLLLTALLLPSGLAAQEPAEINGGTVYSVTCGRCHNPRAPNERTDAEWAVIIQHMRVRANITGAEARAVLGFLQMVNGPGGDVAARRDRALPVSRHVVRARPGSSQGGMAAIADPSWLWTDDAHDTGDVALGKAVAEKYSCAACHKIGKSKTGTLGPDLNTVFTRRDDAFVTRKLIDPKFNNKDNPMPLFPMTEEERAAIVAYLHSLQSGGK